MKGALLFLLACLLVLLLPEQVVLNILGSLAGLGFILGGLVLVWLILRQLLAASREIGGLRAATQEGLRDTWGAVSKPKWDDR